MAEGEILTVETVVAGVVTTEQLQVVTLETPAEIQVVAAGAQGPQGIQGVTGPAGAVTQTLVAGDVLGGHRWVVPDATGAVIYADQTTPTHANKVLGMTLGAALLGADIQIQSSGEHIEPSWTWTLDLPVFLGSNGLMTQTPPTTGFSQIVGFPITATKLMIGLREPLTLS